MKEAKSSVRMLLNVQAEFLDQLRIADVKPFFSYLALPIHVAFCARLQGTEKWNTNTFF